MSEIGFGARFNTGGGDVFVDQITLGGLGTELEVGAGIAIQLDTQLDLQGTTLGGGYRELPLAACGGGTLRFGGRPGCGPRVLHRGVRGRLYCCELAWDAGCVNRAVELCGVAPANDPAAMPGRSSWGGTPSPPRTAPPTARR